MDQALNVRPSAKALLLTVLGEFVLPHGGEAWTSTLIRALGALDVDDRNARQAAARLSDQGLLRSSRQGRRARWTLTESGRDLLTAGTERIYGFGAEDDRWDGRWLVVLASVPEEQRAKRHRLRTRLGFAGFGFLAPGIALTPHVDREATANEILEDLGLAKDAVVLVASPGSLVSEQDLLRRAWDLSSLEASYEGFLNAFGDRSLQDDEERFAAVVELVHAWRAFPSRDPEIPAQLLPTGGPWHRAKARFDEWHTKWSPGAHRWYSTAT